jgi:hypothetical protein
MPVQARKGGAGTPSTQSQPGTRMMCVVSTTPWSLYPHCTGGWVGLGASLDGLEYLATNGMDL